VRRAFFIIDDGGWWWVVVVASALDHGPLAVLRVGSARVDVLVAGSVYLAGGALALLAPGGDGIAPGS
jgi:hypothetical protein